MMYVLGTNYSEVTRKQLEDMNQTIYQVYPTWGETKKWARKVRSEVLEATGHIDDLSFSSTERVVEEIGDRYGRWQDQECKSLKDSLLKLEEPGTGRVRLSTFYQSALQGNWQFSETIDYLRQLGALDESDPQRPSVIIPNYINSPSNCVASSRFYSVCCIDECEAL